MSQDNLKPPAEELFADEIKHLIKADKGIKPPGWQMSPIAVRDFIIGSSDGKVKQKFYGDDALIERCIVTLLGNRGLILVGEPGTAKSMLSELLTAAISGNSTNTIQGTAGTTEDAIRYSWNYAMLINEGPSLESLVPSPIYQGMQQGSLVRFEEITRCQQEIQDSLVSIMSDKVLLIPELTGSDSTLFGQKGFNILATANIRDRGVNEMSSALKRRFNFETVNPIADRKLEKELVKRQTENLLKDVEVDLNCDDEIMDVLVSTFHDLRTGRTEEGTVLEKPSAVMSTAEAVAVGMSAGLDAYYFGEGRLEGRHVARQLVGSVLKDNPDDRGKLKQYFQVVAKIRSKKSKAWKSAWEARKELGL